MQNNEQSILRVIGLSKFFPSSKQWFKLQQYVHAVDDVTFSVNRGETFGIVGESGCGKSTLCKTILRLTEPTKGKILFRGKDLSKLDAEEMRLMRQKLQIIFQDPYASLNPRMTVKELIQAPLDIFSKESEEKKLKKVVEMMHLVGMPEEFMYKYPHEFSGGQRQRIVIARALILDPEFVCCDEPVSALDASVRAQVLNLMKDLQRELKLTYLFISHDLSVVRYMCDRVAVMYLGKIVEMADRAALYAHPIHPYSHSLLASIPVPDPHVQSEQHVLQGEVPSPFNPPSGCHFHTRCPYTSKECEISYPALREIMPGHMVACHKAEQFMKEINRDK